MGYGLESGGYQPARLPASQRVPKDGSRREFRRKENNLRHVAMVWGCRRIFGSKDPPTRAMFKTVGHCGVNGRKQSQSHHCQFLQNLINRSTIET
jgi:hypothetical protein